MIEGYTTAKEIASRWGVTVRTVQTMCAEGKIKGAQKFGSVWAIPADADRPEDKREKNGRYKNWRKNLKGEEL